MIDLLDEAIYQTIHDFKKGSQKGPGALAPLVNMRAGTLNNKADPAMEGHQLSLRESIPVQLTSENYKIAQMYCLSLGGVFFRMPEIKFVSDEALLDAWTKLMVEEGEFSSTIRAALDDGEITEAELNKIQAAMQKTMSARMQLYKRLESLSIQSEGLDQNETNNQ